MVFVTASVPQFLNAAGAPLVNDTSSAFTSPFSMIVSMEFLMNVMVPDALIFALFITMISIPFWNWKVAGIVHWAST